MAFINGLLTFILVLDCVLLIFLVLIQLPKKEAGAGLAFGGSATDALFGAGTGTVLTKVTKYAATTFFVLVLILAVFQTTFANRRSGSDFERRLREAGKASATLPGPPAASTATAPAQTTNTGLLSTPAESPVVPATTNQAPAPAPQQ